MKWLIRGLVALAIVAVLLVLGIWLIVPQFVAISFDRAFLNSLLGAQGPTPEAGEVRHQLQLPQGFELSLFATDVRNARFMAVTANDDLLVASPRGKTVYLLFRDQDGDGAADGRKQLLTELNRPHSVALQGEWLYVAEMDGIGRVRFDAEARALTGDYQRILNGLPEGGNHWTKTIDFGPDGDLYLAIGSSCNVCEETDPRRATIMRLQPDGSDPEIFASGLRNSVGFDWSPRNGALYATDNGRDLLGDDYPPCELNRVQEGGFYGWPYANGWNRPDPDFGPGNEERIANAIEPVHGFRAHNAPLGIAFIEHAALPDEYHQQALVALHGSWNRSEKDGYEVVSLHWQADGDIQERDFLTGFLTESGDVIGRPVDVAQASDGAIYISDDYAGAIYRVRYRGEDARPSSIALEAPAADTTADGPLSLTPAQAEQARLGKSLIQSNGCLACHSIGGFEGGGELPLQALYTKYDVATLSEFFLAPTPPMPRLDLPASERQAIALYLLSQP